MHCMQIMDPEEARFSRHPADQTLCQRRLGKLRCALAKTPHSVSISYSSSGEVKKLHCKRCLTFRAVGKCLKWLKSTCNLDAVVHNTHCRRVYKGLHYCTRCGAWGSLKCAKLKAQCTGRLSHAGRLSLRDISRGLMPFGLRSWPDGEPVLEVV